MSSGDDDFTSAQVLDAMSTMLALVDPQGRVLWANAQLESELRLSRRQLIGHDLVAFLSRGTPWGEALQQVVSDSFSSQRCDGALIVRGQAQPLPVQLIVSGTGRADTLLVELVELSQHSRQERETQWLNQAQANKDLIRNLAHEIKNPLGGIRGAAQLLQMELAGERRASPTSPMASGVTAGHSVNPGTWESRELFEYTRVIIHEADRLQSLVDRLLAPHRTPRVEVDVNIHEVLERVRSVILAEFPQGLRVVRDYDASIPEFRGDREQLIQAILNIAHNAALVLAARREAGGARIVFKTRVARQVTLARRRHRLALVLHITDNGPGVPDDIKERMFLPLVSGRDGGSGLGLTLAQTFIQHHQGSIECDSEPGMTEFRITLPLP